jgi:hypothetical protein
MVFHLDTEPLKLARKMASGSERPAWIAGQRHHDLTTPESSPSSTAYTAS